MKTELDLSRMTLRGIASRLNPLRDRIRSRFSLTVFKFFLFLVSILRIVKKNTNRKRT